MRTPLQALLSCVLATAGCARAGFQPAGLAAQSDRAGVELRVDAPRGDAPGDGPRRERAARDTSRLDGPLDSAKEVPPPALGWAIIQVAGSSPVLNALWGSDPSTIYGAGSSGGKQAVFQLISGGFHPVYTTTPTGALQDIHGVGAQDYFAVGDDGSVLVHQATGWSSVKTTLWPGFFAVWGSGPDSIWAGGGNGSAISKLARVAMGTWTDFSSSFPSQIGGLWGTSALNVYAVGWAGKVARFDGTSWLAVPISAPSGAVLNGIWGSGPTDIWIVGSNGLNAPYTVLHYSPSGWSQFDPGKPLMRVCGAGSAVFAIGWSSGVYQLKSPPSPTLVSLGAPSTFAPIDCLAFSATDLYVAAGASVLHYGYH